MRYRRGLIVGLHVVLIVAANGLAFLLRFDGVVPDRDVLLFLTALPWLIGIRMVTFIPFRLYEGLWRYTSIWDLSHITIGVVVSSGAFYVLIRWGLGLVGYPRSVFLVDSLLLIFMLGGLRLMRRVYREVRHAARGKRVLVYGAGDAGEMIVRDMRHNPFYEYEPIGFIDDDGTKVGQRIHGVKVLGTREDLGWILAAEVPDAILVAMPRAEPATLRSILRSLEPFRVPIQTLPNLRDVLDGKVTVSQIRTLSVEDLLDRAPVGLDIEPVRHLFEGKRVLVTGAGGSIGSELARQILALGPTAMTLLDRYENGLYGIDAELAAHAGACHLNTLVADVTDVERINAVLSAHRPDIIFHAAAHKHVPLMEVNPCEAVKNNVRGSRVLAEAARAFGVERFILVSSDKAVNPSSVMGATKRVGELLLHSMNHTTSTIFAAVRFGNVLASNGSVVPRFLAQIKAGGPVTVTHPEMQRYFMLIPEAVQLVIHAAALAKGGDIFVLEMGQPVKVLDLARNLIRLSGFLPDEEIPIVFVGLRPGEKLYEELVGADEAVTPLVAGILRVEPTMVPHPEVLARGIAALERAAASEDSDAVMCRLRELVPTYEWDQTRAGDRSPSCGTG